MTLFFRTLLLISASLIQSIDGISIENCYRAKRPHKSSCALPNLWSMREKLCSSDENWGEGYRFLSGHGLNLRVRDNCTADHAPLGIYVALTISSTVKNRTDCWQRTKSIITRCVDEGYPEFNGGEWWDLDGEDDPNKDSGNGKTFIWLQYLHEAPPTVPDPCYVFPTPEYCPPYPGSLSARSDKEIKSAGKGTFIELDPEGRVLGKRYNI